MGNAGVAGETRRSCLSTFRHEQRPSFSVSANGLRYYDFAEGKGGDAINFLARATGVSNTAAFTEFIELVTNPELPIKPVDFNGEASTCERGKTAEATPDKALARIGNLPQLFTEFNTPTVAATANDWQIFQDSPARGGRFGVPTRSSRLRPRADPWVQYGNRVGARKYGPGLDHH